MRLSWVDDVHLQWEMSERINKDTMPQRFHTLSPSSSPGKICDNVSNRPAAPYFLAATYSCIDTALEWLESHVLESLKILQHVESLLLLTWISLKSACQNPDHKTVVKPYNRANSTIFNDQTLFWSVQYTHFPTCIWSLCTNPKSVGMFRAFRSFLLTSLTSCGLHPKERCGATAHRHANLPEVSLCEKFLGPKSGGRLGTYGVTESLTFENFLLEKKKLSWCFPNFLRFYWQLWPWVSWWTWPRKEATLSCRYDLYFKK